VITAIRHVVAGLQGPCTPASRNGVDLYEAGVQGPWSPATT